MNTHVLEGKWNQVRGEVQSRWGKLTDDDLDRVAGDHKKLLGKLQEHYGYSEEEAQRELGNFVNTARALKS